MARGGIRASTVALGADSHPGRSARATDARRVFRCGGIGNLGVRTAQYSLKLNGCRVIGSIWTHPAFPCPPVWAWMPFCIRPMGTAPDMSSDSTDGIGADGFIITASSPSDVVPYPLHSPCAERRVVSRRWAMRAESSTQRHDTRRNWISSYPLPDGSVIRPEFRGKGAGLPRRIRPVDGKPEHGGCGGCLRGAPAVGPAHYRNPPGGKFAWPARRYSWPSCGGQGDSSHPRAGPNPSSQRPAIGDRVRIARRVREFARSVHLPNLTLHSDRFHLHAVVCGEATSVAKQVPCGLLHDAEIPRPEVDVVLITPARRNGPRGTERREARSS